MELLKTKADVFLALMVLSITSTKTAFALLTST